MACCPACGQEIRKPLLTAEQALARMDSDVDLYKGQDGNWYLMCGRGQVHSDTVAQMVAKGTVRDKYSDLPDQCYTVGRTIDIPRTKAARNKYGKKAGTIYVGDPDVPHSETTR